MLFRFSKARPSLHELCKEESSSLHSNGLFLIQELLLFLNMNSSFDNQFAWQILVTSRLSKSKSAKGYVFDSVFTF